MVVQDNNFSFNPIMAGSIKHSNMPQTIEPKVHKQTLRLTSANNSLTRPQTGKVGQTIIFPTNAHMSFGEIRPQTSSNAGGQGYHRRLKSNESGFG